MLRDKEKNFIKVILILMQEIDVRILAQIVTRNFVGIKMLSDKEKYCIKNILLLMQEIDVRNLAQPATRNLVGI